MASPSLPDADLRALQEARSLARKAKEAQRALAEWSQERVDALVAVMAEAARGDAERLARLAHEETGFGNVKDKTTKNLFASVQVHDYIRPLRTVGVLREDKEARIVEMAEPMGVVAAVIPSTNPTSTAIFKALISVKARNAVVMSPHPAARRAILETVELMKKAAVGAGLPPDALSCLTEVSLGATQELMKSRDTGVVLATGGIGLVRAAYSSGKPAYGVGPGNVAVFIERTADVPQAVRDVIAGKTFDYGTLCSSEQSIVCDRPICEAVVEEVRKNGGYFLSAAEALAMAKVAVTPERLANPEVVGKPATYIADRAGVKVPPDTRVLVARLEGVGRDYPLSIEKLCPILAFYEVDGAEAGTARCLELLRFGGTGHTVGIHSRDDKVIRAFAAREPVYRVIVNTQTSMGATGYTTGLAPSMSLGCGAFAGNITSDNITPLHLINVKRVAYARPRDPAAAAPKPPAPAAKTPSAEPATAGEALDFVCEADVKRALREGRTLRVAARAIVTPAARDAAEGTSVLTVEA